MTVTIVVKVVFVLTVCIKYLEGQLKKSNIYWILINDHIFNKRRHLLLLSCPLYKGAKPSGHGLVPICGILGTQSQAGGEQQTRDAPSIFTLPPHG